MVEKIIVDRDEVIHYSWLDHTWVYVHYTRNAITQAPLFGKWLAALFRYGLKAVARPDLAEVINENGYLFIKCDTNEIVDALKNACRWLKGHLRVTDTTSEQVQFFLTHKALFFGILEETQKILEEKSYTYYFQRVDGMN